MSSKEKAKELVEKFKNTKVTISYMEDSVPCVLRSSMISYSAKEMALICVDNEYNGIIYVLGELKARGELSSEMYLKALDDLNQEREEVKEEINKL